MVPNLIRLSKTPIFLILFPQEFSVKFCSSGFGGGELDKLNVAFAELLSEKAEAWSSPSRLSTTKIYSAF